LKLFAFHCINHLSSSIRFFFFKISVTVLVDQAMWRKIAL